MEPVNLQNVLDEIQKTISAPTYTNPAGLTLVRENLSPMVTRLVDRLTPLRDRLVRKTGSGLAASWNVLTAITNNNSAFTEGGTPTENNATYARRSAVYKELGKKKSITTRMLEAGASFMDQEVEQTQVAMREVIQDEERLIIQGDSGSNPLEFDGLDTLITTNILDDNNNALGFRTDLLDEAIANLLDNYGVMPTAIYCSYQMKRAINQSLAGDVRVNLDVTNQVATGLDVGFYQSAVGKLPFVPSFAIVDDAATYVATNNIVSHIYIVTEKFKGQDVIYLEDLYPLGKEYLAKTGAAVNFMVTEGTVLVCRIPFILPFINYLFLWKCTLKKIHSRSFILMRAKPL